jgi:CRP-like cAMP-binding protein
MFLPQTQVFKDLRQETINDISEIAVEQSYDQGVTLFKRGEPANHFYILVEGKIRLGMGEQARMNYVVENLGEAFGWSSIVGNRSYTAEAECLEPSRCLRIEKNDLENVFDNHARSARVFYKRLAAALGQRLIDTHR